MKRGDAVLTTCTAPCSRSSASCSGLRTMLTRPMPSARQIRFSIWPRFDAAAVWTSALWPSRRIVSVMPRAVSGLTKHDAPSAALVPAGSGRQSSAFTVRYCEYIAPPRTATVLPSSACAAGAAAGRDHGARAFVADRHRLAEAAGHRLHRRVGDARRGHRALAAAAHGERRQVGGAEQQADVGRVDRRRLDAHDDFVGGRRGRRDANERELELAAVLDEGAELESVAGRADVHGIRLPWGGRKLPPPARIRVSALDTLITNGDDSSMDVNRP